MRTDSNDTLFLDEQFKLVTGSKSHALVFVVFFFYAFNYYFSETNTQSISWTTPIIFAAFVLMVSTFAYRSGIVSTNFARRLVHGFVTYGPIFHAIALLCSGESGGESPAKIIPKDMLRVRFGLLAVAPILGGIFVRLPWECVLWSRLTTLGLVSFSWYRLVSAEEWATRSTHFMFVQAMQLAFMFIAVLTLFVAHSLDEAQREIYKLRHRESTAIIGAVSHDLRTPIHVLRSILDDLQAPEKSKTKLGSPQIQEELGQAKQACQRMAGSVEDLLLASTAYTTGGSVMVVEKPVELQSFLQGILNQHKKHQVESSSDSVDISLQIGEVVPRVIMTDERRLYQIVNNLITNAGKFTQNGSIRLACCVDSISDSPTAEASYTLKFAVADTGIGIDREGAKKLRTFSAFNQVSRRSAVIEEKKLAQIVY
jgi:signal transduction histidine kinase